MSSRSKDMNPRRSRHPTAWMPPAAAPPRPRATGPARRPPAADQRPTVAPPRPTACPRPTTRRPAQQHRADVPAHPQQRRQPRQMICRRRRHRVIPAHQQSRNRLRRFRFLERRRSLLRIGPAMRIQGRTGPLERRPTRHPDPTQFDTERHRRHIPQPLQLEVDQAQRLVHPDTDRRAARQHRAITAQASLSVGASNTSETLIPNVFRASARSRCGLISVVTAVPSSNATASSTGRGRDIRPSSPTVSIPIAQYRRAPESLTEVRETARSGGRSSDPSAAQAFSAPARPTMCTGSMPHRAGPSRTSPGEVHHQALQCLSLALVDRDRPRQLERQLRVRADHLPAQ